MRVLFFVDSFLPGYKGGGPVISVSNMATMLKGDLNILICTKNHDFGSREVYREVASDKVTTFEGKSVIYLSKMNIYNVMQTIDNFNPDVIYLNGFFAKSTQIVLFLNYIRRGKRVVVAPRGQLQENALKLKSFKKTVYLLIYKFFRIQTKVCFHSTDSIESNSIKQVLNSNNIFRVQNAVKEHYFEPLVKRSKMLRVLFVSRISEKKNLLFALKLLKFVEKEIVFDIYGPKEDINYWSKCEAVISQLPSHISVSYKGELPQPRVVTIMRDYHAFFLPTLSENFGHVIVEAMQAGLIPVISDQTPWLNLQKLGVGWSISLDKKESYVRAIEDLCEMQGEDYTNKSLGVMRYIRDKIDNKMIAKEYLDLFKQC